MSNPHDDPNVTARRDWQPLPDGVEVSIDVQLKRAPYSGQAVIYEWTPSGDASVRPEHAARWPRSSWPRGAVIKVTAPSSTREAQRDQWAAFVRGHRLSKRMKRAQRTTALTWANNLRCFVLELQRDRAAVLFTSGCQCPACRTETQRTASPSNPDLTRGPRRLTRAQRKLNKKAKA